MFITMTVPPYSVMFHRQHRSASASPAEKCRRELHIAAGTVDILSICYFAMVLGDELQPSSIVLSILQIPVCISAAVLASRMWIYTNDPLLLRKSPEVLAISTWLEIRLGHYVTYAFVSIAPVGAIFLGLQNRAEMGLKLISVGIIVLGIIAMAVFWVCGKSLMRAIDESIRRHQQTLLLERGASRVSRGEDECAAEYVGREWKRRNVVADPKLLAARRKVKMMIIFAFATLVQTIGILLFAILSKYGTAAPLLLFLVPMTFVPQIWNAVNIQVHARRTKLPPGLSSRSMQPNATRFTGSKYIISRNQQPRVVPVEAPATAPNKSKKEPDVAAAAAAE